MSYDSECIEFAAAFSRFLAELRTMGAGFDYADADLARAIDNALPADSGFEATFDMVVRGFVLAQKAAA